jgi:hypothetical protein
VPPTTTIFISTPPRNLPTRAILWIARDSS